MGKLAGVLAGRCVKALRGFPEGKTPLSSYQSSSTTSTTSTHGKARRGTEAKVWQETERVEHGADREKEGG